MRAAASASSNLRSNHNQTDCLADSLTDSCAIHLNPKQDNLCEELARTAQSSPAHPLRPKMAFRPHQKSWGMRPGYRLGIGQREAFGRSATIPEKAAWRRARIAGKLQQRPVANRLILADNIRCLPVGSV